MFPLCESEKKIGNLVNFSENISVKTFSFIYIFVKGNIKNKNKTQGKTSPEFLMEKCVDQ